MARQKSKQLAEFFQHPEHLFDGMKDFTISHPNPDNIILEIGPGNGDYFAHLVSTNPGKLCIGVDLRNDRLVKWLHKTKSLSDNTSFALISDDYWNCIENLPDNSIKQLYIYFPNLWPKKRDWKKRFFQMDVIDTLAKKLKTDATIKLKTDEYEYFLWTRILFAHKKATFQETKHCLDLHNSDIKEENYITTVFEKRWVSEGKKVFLLQYRKK